MDNITTATYILYSDTIKLTTSESKENAIIVETPPHETYDIIQNLYASFQYRIKGEVSDRSLTVKVAQLNKVSCDVTDNRLTYSGFEAISNPDASTILSAIQSAIETEVDSIHVERQFKSASKSATANYELMFTEPLIYSNLIIENNINNEDVEVSEDVLTDVTDLDDELNTNTGSDVVLDPDFISYEEPQSEYDDTETSTESNLESETEFIDDPDSNLNTEEK